MGSVHSTQHGAPLTRPALVSPRRAVCLLCAALALALTAGCSNNPYSAGESARATLYSALSDDPKTLDPSVVYVLDDAQVASLIYPSYFRYHYLKRDPIVLELNLGAAPPARQPYRYTVQEGGRRVEKLGELWTFRIRRDLRFQDDPCFPGGKGRGITAADFLYSFRRMADPALSCPIVSFVDDKIVGFSEYATENRARAAQGLKADLQRPVAGLQPVPGDPYAFRVLLSQPYPQLRYLMAMTFTTPIAHEAVERYGKELARHPVGCGPYLLAERIPKLRMVLRANPNRPREVYPSEGMPGDREAGLLRDAGKQLPFADTIVITIMKEGITGWNQFLQGYRDAWGVTQENYQQALTSRGTLSEAMRRRGVRLSRAPELSLWYFAFNMKDPVFGGYAPRKRKLRQAISLAFDAQADIDLNFQGAGRQAQFIIPPGLFGYDPNYRNPYRQYSVEKAKRLLAQAGYPGGIDPKTGERLTIYLDNSATTAGGRQEVALVSKWFDAIGIRMVSRSWQFATFQEKIDTRQYQFTLWGWIADYPDPENFLMLLYGPRSRDRGPNPSCYDNSEYNRLFEQMRTMDDGPARAAVIRRMRDIAVEDCPWIYMVNPEARLLSYDWLSNLSMHPIAVDTAKYRRVDGPKRARRQAEWNRPNYWPAAAGAALLIAGSLPAVRVVRRRRHRTARRRPGGPH